MSIVELDQASYGSRQSTLMAYSPYSHHLVCQLKAFQADKYAHLEIEAVGCGASIMTEPYTAPPLTLVPSSLTIKQ